MAGLGLEARPAGELAIGATAEEELTTGTTAEEELATGATTLEEYPLQEAIGPGYGGLTYDADGPAEEPSGLVTVWIAVAVIVDDAPTCWLLATGVLESNAYCVAVWVCTLVIETC
jgi:hypothetical protein